jgi:hypothetical protein
MAIAFPFLMLILAGGINFGLGLYQANMASSAIQQPSLKKLEMADTPGAIAPATVLAWVTGADSTKGTIKSGNAVDSVKFANQQAETEILVGTKGYKAIAPFLPSFDITVAQGINKNLLLASSGGAARVRPASVPWVPGGAPRTPPWKDPIMQNAPPDFRMNPNCAKVPVGEDAVGALNSEVQTDKTYISNKPVAFFSAVSLPTLIQLSQQFEGACANDGADVCQKEHDDLMPKPPKDQPAELKLMSGVPPGIVSYAYQTKNPPGGPGTVVTYTFQCSKTFGLGGGKFCKSPQPSGGIITHNPDIGADHGLYFDPTAKYEKPPDPGFMDSCKSRKQAECMLKKGTERADQIMNRYHDACP